jgi:DNA mismatch repair protein MutS
MNDDTKNTTKAAKLSLVPRGIFKEYFDHHDHYTAIYGSRMVVVMQVGQFYEIYAVKNEERALDAGPDIYHISDTLNIQVARKNKEIREISYANVLMAGVPDHAFVKHRDVLLHHGYTIVKVEQVTPPPNPERKVTEILSPGTLLEGLSGSCCDTNHLVSLYLGVYPQIAHQTSICVGLAAIDVATGNNHVHSIVSPLGEDRWINEVYRLIHIYRPSETIVHFDPSDTIAIAHITKEYACHTWQLSNATTHWNILHNPRFQKPSYQQEFYQKLYPDTGSLSPIEYLGFERDPEIVMSHLYMLQFIYEHKLENVRDVKRPQRCEPTEHLSLSHNAMYQLYLVDTKEHSGERYSSLLTLLNTCKTAMGRRLCKARLLNPIVDPKVLRHRYDQIEGFQRMADSAEEATESTEFSYVYDACRASLQGVMDIEKLYRKMSLGVLHPYEFANLHQSHCRLNEACRALSLTYSEFLVPYRDTLQQLGEFHRESSRVFKCEELEKYSIDTMETSVFQRGVCAEMDVMEDSFATATREFTLFCETLGTYLDRKKPEMVRRGYTDRHGHYVYLTGPRAKVLRTRLIQMGETDIVFKDGSREFFQCSAKVLANSLVSRGTAKETTVNLLFVSNLSNTLLGARKRIIALNRERYRHYLSEFTRSWRTTFERSVEMTSLCDLNASIAKLSHTNHYCRPTLESTPTTSFLEARALRHPLVEKVQTEIPYIPNDLSLCEDGMLLYGTNACGKSTLMKSVGLAVVMAQAGFFVPCTTLHFSPYTQLFTRILNTDNLFQGQSSFAVEMSELRHILKESNERSLILGDELCSGTENVSALSIVSAGLKTLSERRASFIFTSHLHQLMEIPLVSKIPNLTVNHLQIHYDPVTEVLTYDRKLVPGSGPAIYGLEVCKAMDLGSEFVALARSVQTHLTGSSKTFVNDKSSRYNSAVSMDLCGVCSKPSEETHHIREQREADSLGRIEHFHKNIEHNLVPLCKLCHAKVTYGTLRIEGYRQTSQGRRLHILHIEKEPHSKLKT